MSSGIPDEELYRRAKERVEEKRGFFVHLAVYVLVNVVLIIVWAVAGGGFPWFVFVLGGWGIGILMHCLSVFVFSRDSQWHAKQIEKEMERLRKKGR